MGTLVACRELGVGGRGGDKEESKLSEEYRGGRGGE